MVSSDKVEKLPYSLSIIMNNVQVLVYGVLESVRDPRNIFVGHSHLKNCLKHPNFIEIFCSCVNSSGKRNKMFLTIFLWRSYLKKENYVANYFYETFSILQRYRNILLWKDQDREHKFGCVLRKSTPTNYIKKRKYGTTSF